MVPASALVPERNGYVGAANNWQGRRKEVFLTQELHLRSMGRKKLPPEEKKKRKYKLKREDPYLGTI